MKELMKVKGAALKETGKGPQEEQVEAGEGKGSKVRGRCGQ